MNTQRTNLYRMMMRPGERRGNAIVLVAAILVLLVIIATAYITRTQSQRTVSVATREIQQREISIDTIANAIAREIAEALFVRPIEPTAPNPFDANYPRLTHDAYREMTGRQPTRYNIDPNFPWNFAPFETVPRTNWPMAGFVTGYPGIGPDDAVSFLPSGPGNAGLPGSTQMPGDAGGDGSPQAQFRAAILSTEFNPLGNPGTSDHRWLADIEPVRWQPPAVAPLIPTGEGDAFMFWRKLTNLSHANNSWRVIADIANVDANIVHDLNIPVEQWLPARPFFGANPFSFSTMSLFNNNAATTNFNPLVGGDLFRRQWYAWFGLDPDRETPSDPLMGGYLTAYLGLNGGNPGIPPNFYNLSDLNASGSTHSYPPSGIDPQDTPDAEFIPGRARNLVSRVLADTTGDGFTDAYWFTPPTPIVGETRQIVSVRIVDNSAMINPNVATKFVRNDPANLATQPSALAARRKTRGHTPADIALVGQVHPSVNNFNTWENSTWNVGFYDNYNNWLWPGDGPLPVLLQQYGLPGTTDNFSARALWFRHVRHIGLVNAGGGLISPPSFPTPVHPLVANEPTNLDRLRIWGLSGRHGLGYDQDRRVAGYQQYSLADEMSMRAFHGNNNPWMLSTYEFANHANAQSRDGFFRAGFNPSSIETSEYVNQLNNRELLRDNRRKVTMYSGARNDLLPPSLQRPSRFYSPEIVAFLAAPCANPLLLDRLPVPPMIRTLVQQACATGDPNAAQRIVRQYLDQSMQKIDLREHYGRYYSLIVDLPNIPAYGGAPTVPDAVAHPDAGRLNFRERLADTLLLAMHDVFHLPNPFYVLANNPIRGYTVPQTGPPPTLVPRIYQSYYGPFVQDAASYTGAFPGATAPPAYTDVHSPMNLTRRLAGAYSASILAERMNWPQLIGDEVLAPEFDPVPGVAAIESLPQGVVPGVTSDPNDRVGYFGMEPQPFLVEAFIAHAYKARKVPIDYFDIASIDPDIPDDQYSNSDHYFVMDDGNEDDYRTTIVVVQLANPFDMPIDLHRYQIKIFNNEPIPLEDVMTTPESRYLLPSTDDRPITAVLYAMRTSLGNADDPDHSSPDPVDSIRRPWRDFLDLMTTSPNDVVVIDTTESNRRFPIGTIIADVTSHTNMNVRNRAVYDNYTTALEPQNEGGILLSRIMDFDDLTGMPDPNGWVVVDRFDAVGEPRFASAVSAMSQTMPSSRPTGYPNLQNFPPQGAGGPHPVINSNDWPDYYFGAGSTDEERPHWVQWVRVTRAWGASTNGKIIPGGGARLMYESHERNPRYVFSDAAVIVPTLGTVAPLPDIVGEPIDNSFYVHSSQTSVGGEGEFETPIVAQRGGNRYDFDRPSNGDAAGNNPWFIHAYYDARGTLHYQAAEAVSTFPARKPTFFTLRWREGDWDGVSEGQAARRFFMPDKGWYGQYALAIDRDTLDPAGGFALNYNGGVLDPPLLLNDSDTTELMRYIGNDGVVRTSSAFWSGPSLPLLRHPYSMQMTQKNKKVRFSSISLGYASWIDDLNPPVNTRAWLLKTKDFEQIGELLNVWLFGHEVIFDSGDYSRTETTFSEFMSGQRRLNTSGGSVQPEAPRLWQLTGGARPFTDTIDDGTGPTAIDQYFQWLRSPETRRVNRLRLTPKLYDTDSDGAPDVFLGALLNNPAPPDPGAGGFFPGSPTYLDLVEAYTHDPRQAWPTLPAGVRVLDAFVCDGPGAFVQNFEADPLPHFQWFNQFGEQMAAGSGGIGGQDAALLEIRRIIDSQRFYNANAFDRRMTPGMINVNTATPEVMRAMPHLTRLVHEGFADLSVNPYSFLSNAIVRYRDRLGLPAVEPGFIPHASMNWANNALPPLRHPDYAQRGRGGFGYNDFFFGPGDQMARFAPGLRGERGMASIGELTLLTQSARFTKAYDPDFRWYGYDSSVISPGDVREALLQNSAWRVDHAGMTERSAISFDLGIAMDGSFALHLYPEDVDGAITSTNTRISTDTVDMFDWRTSSTGAGNFNYVRPDNVAEDTHESNLLFSGVSNIVTTRSDTFTVYFRVRTFRKNPVTGIWDATDPNYIIDDTRYIMLVDRSEVEQPSDRPKILYLEKITH